MKQQEHIPKITPPSKETMRKLFQFLADSDIPEKIAAKRAAKQRFAG